MLLWRVRRAEGPMRDGDAIATLTGEEPLPPDGAAPVTPPHLAALGVTLGLAACGGAGGMAPAPAPVTPPAAPMPSRLQAARFLSQAAMGASRANVDAVVAQGYAGWLDA